MSLIADGLTVLSNSAFVVASNASLTIENTEITALNTAIDVQGAGATATINDANILATIGVESVEHAVININRSEIEADSCAINMKAGVFVVEEIRASEVTINDTKLSSARETATQDNTNATVYVGQLAKVVITNNHGEKVTNTNGTAVLVDNSFIPDKADSAFAQEGASDGKITYEDYLNTIKNLFYVDVVAGNVEGEIAEVVRGQYADQYVGRIIVDEGGVEGLALKQAAS